MKRNGRTVLRVELPYFDRAIGRVRTWCGRASCSWQCTQGDGDVISMPAGFRRRLVGKTLINVFHCDMTEISSVGKLTDIFINQRIECCLDNTINLRPLTAHIMCRVIPTTWRSYRGHSLCDVTAPYRSMLVVVTMATTCTAFSVEWE